MSEQLLIQDFGHSFLSIMPPVVAILLAIFSKRVFLSLGAGIVLGALLLVNFNLTDFLTLMFQKITHIFYYDSHLNKDSLLILSFLIILGVLTETLQASGGQEAFTHLASQKIKSRKGTLLLTTFFGFLIFIDDYFNALAVGSICRPLSDKQKISRSKLSYLIHSTAGPVCAIAPISSWGATIMGILSGIFVAHDLGQFNPLLVFIEIIPLNFYSLNALLMILISSIFSFDFPLMKSHQKLADENPSLFDEETNLTPLSLSEVKAKVWALLIPIIILILGVFFLIFFIGYLNLPKNSEITLVQLMGHSEVGKALALGGLFSVCVSFLFIPFSPKKYFKLTAKGIQSMIPAIQILLFAWTIGSIVKDMKTGVYLSGMLHGNLGPNWIPPLIFVLSGIMAFSTGSSWATFGIMLPIAADTTLAIDPSLMIISFGAVIGGAVFGDHSSPISDTTILAATGAKCSHMDHVLTQLPYCLLAAFIAFIGHLITGITRLPYLSYGLSILFLSLLIIFSKKFLIKEAK